MPSLVQKMLGNTTSCSLDSYVNPRSRLRFFSSSCEPHPYPTALFLRVKCVRTQLTKHECFFGCTVFCRIFLPRIQDLAVPLIHSSNDLVCELWYDVCRQIRKSKLCNMCCVLRDQFAVRRMGLRRHPSLLQGKFVCIECHFLYEWLYFVVMVFLHKDFSWFVVLITIFDWLLSCKDLCKGLNQTCRFLFLCSLSIIEHCSLHDILILVWAVLQVVFAQTLFGRSNAWSCTNNQH